MKKYIPFENILYIEEINRTFTVIQEYKINNLYELINGVWFPLNTKQEPKIVEKVNSYFNTSFDSTKEEPFLRVEILEELFNISIIDCYGNNPITIETSADTLEVSLEDINKKIIEYIVKNNYSLNIKDADIFEYRLIKKNEIKLFNTIDKTYHNNHKTKALIDVFKFIKQNNSQNNMLNNISNSSEINIVESIISQGLNDLKEYEENEFVLLNHLKEYLVKHNINSKFRSIHQMTDDAQEIVSNSYSYWVLYLKDFKIYIDLDGIYEYDKYIEKIANKHNHDKDLVGFMTIEPVMGEILEICYEHLIKWFEFCNLRDLMLEDGVLKKHLVCSIEDSEECPF